MKLVILDRDGVINKESAAYIKSPAECDFIPGSLEAIAKLSHAGYTILVATNQSGVGRGYFTLDTLQAIHQKIYRSVEAAGGKITKIYFCPHAPDAGCECRKPKPGMFKQIEHDFNLSLRDIDATFIGDSLRDVELGLATGCKFYLVTGADTHGQETLTQLSNIQKQQISIVNDLAAATARILA